MLLKYIFDYLKADASTDFGWIILFHNISILEKFYNIIFLLSIVIYVVNYKMSIASNPYTNLVATPSMPAHL
jgi:hypothetical protein